MVVKALLLLLLTQTQMAESRSNEINDSLTVTEIHLLEAWSLKELLEATISPMEYDMLPVWMDEAKANATDEDFLLQGICRKIRDNTQCPFKCFPCQQSECSMGTCCLEDLSQRTKREEGKYTGCLKDGVVGIVRCPDRWRPDDPIRLDCETGRGRFTQDQPMSDVKGELTFRHVACGVCHGVRELVPWKVKVSCDHFQHVFSALTEDELKQQALQHPDTCQLSSLPPEGVLEQQCDGASDKWYVPRTQVVTSCNVTGRWALHDQHLEDGCTRYTALSLRVYHEDSDSMFQNLFCVECNGLDPDHCHEGRMFNMGSRGPGLPPLTLLLGLQDRSEPRKLPGTKDNCSEASWQDPQGYCHNISCTAGKVFSAENGTCSTALFNIRGLSYRLHLLLLPQAPPPPTAWSGWTDFWERFNDTLWNKLPNVTHGDVNVTSHFTTGGVGGGVALGGVLVTGWVDSTRDIPRDVLENRWVDNVMDDWNITVEDSVSFIFSVECAGKELQELLYGGAATDFILKINAGFPQRFRGDPNIAFDLTIPITHVLTCPFVEFSESQFEVVVHAKDDSFPPPLEVHLTFQDVSLSLFDTSKMEARRNGTVLRVCLSLLKNFLSDQLSNRNQVPESGSMFWEYVLNMTVMPLSMLCLVLLLGVYCLLPALRTLPGLNLMGICCSLLLAQLSLLVAAHRPVQGHWCTALGMLVHASWLSTFCWTLVASVHMHRTFSSSSNSRSGSGSGSGVIKRWGKGAAVTIVLPVVVVGAVVLWSWVSSGGGSTGYSGRICMLESAWLVGLALVLPLGLVLTTNVLLFAVTLYRIRQVIQLQAQAETRSDNSSRQHLHACFRLSLLTGATWILSLLAEGLQLQWLRVISVLVNGGQGALLLLSYVTTHRVAAMLAVRLGCRHAGEPKSGGAVTSMTTAVGSSKSPSSPAVCQRISFRYGSDVVADVSAGQTAFCAQSPEKGATKNKGREKLDSGIEEEL